MPNSSQPHTLSGSYFIEGNTHVVVLPELPLLDLARLGVPSDETLELAWGNASQEHTLRYKLNRNHLPGRNTAHHAPAIIYESGLTVWPITRYLIELIRKKSNSSHLPFSTTSEIQKARHLSFFANWCFENKVDIFNFDFVIDEDKPVHRFRDSLIRQYESIHTTKASEIIKATISFYRWSQNVGYVDQYASMWDDKKISVLLRQADGRALTKEILQSSLSIHAPKRSKYSLPNPDRVTDDGESLRPLPKEEQNILINALSAIDNYQYSLIFMIGIMTGMRKQSILTLREQSIKILEAQLSNGASEATLNIGGNQLVNSKKNKIYTACFPKILVKYLVLYRDSPQRIERASLANRLGYSFEDSNHQHLFLTQQGRPMYTGWDHPMRKEFDVKGAALNSFIKQALLPKLKEMGMTQHFIFHDTRATYAYNFLLENYDADCHDPVKRNRVLAVLKARMGHSSISTTEHYLNCGVEYDTIKSANIDFLAQLLGRSSAELR